MAISVIKFAFLFPLNASSKLVAFLLNFSFQKFFTVFGEIDGKIALRSVKCS